MTDLSTHHSSVASVATYLVNVNPNLPAHLADIANLFSEVADVLLEKLDDSPELTVSLRKLLESKDAAVRAALPQTAVSTALKAVA